MAADLIGLIPDPWFQTGLICREISNSQRAKGPFAKTTDFMPNYKPELETETALKLIQAQASIHAK